MTFYENVEVGPPTKSNQGPLLKLLRRCTELTPAERGVVTKRQLIDGREGPHDDRVKVESLDQHPQEVSQQQVVEQRHHQLTQTLRAHTPTPRAGCVLCVLINTRSVAVFKSRQNTFLFSGFLSFLFAVAHCLTSAPVKLRIEFGP